MGRMHCPHDVEHGSTSHSRKHHSEAKSMMSRTHHTAYLLPRHAPFTSNLHLQVLSERFTEPVAKAFEQEMERWLEGNFGDELVEMQPPVYCDNHIETEEARAIANRSVKEWITAYVPSPDPEPFLPNCRNR